MADVNYSRWELYYTTDDDGVWIKDGTAKICLGHEATVQDAIDAAEPVERERVTALWREAAAALEPERGEDEVTRLRRALEVYADPKNWAIRRGPSTYADCIWVGPGAVDRVYPDGPGVARAALGVEGKQEPGS
jgi:hypothetical protein